MAKSKPKEETTETETKPAKQKASGAVYTYVGGGESSPHRIHFMGLQHFKRGEATEVTDPQVLAKIVNNPSFEEGEVDPDELSTYDDEAAKEAEDQRKKDKALDAEIKKNYAKHRSKAETE